MQIRWFNN